MAFKLYSHPLSSFCHKALIALYENGTAFEPVLVDFGDPKSVAAFRAIWPMAKMPVLRDEARGRTVAESTVVIEYLDAYYPGATRFIPADPERAWQARMWDRFFDHYVQVPMQTIVGDRLRPAGLGDPFGVEQAVAQLHKAYGVIEQSLELKSWVLGGEFTLAECSAAPALFYANTVAPLGREHGRLAGYLDRLMARPSYARVLAEAQPYFNLFPLEKKPELSRASA
jgi:glutathione S-transferase